MNTITLSLEEIQDATIVGLKRTAMHDKVGRSRPSGVLAANDAHVQGAIAELAVSKYYEIPWDGRFFENEDWKAWRKNGHDVSGLEVRATKHPRGRLILHPYDKDDDIFVLVRSHISPVFQIVGWCYGREGKIDKNWHDVGYGKPCFFVPNEVLKS